MKRFMVPVSFALMLSVAVNLTAAMARAETAPMTTSDDYDDSQSYPLRVVAYLVYPVGYAAEWIIFRPLHRLVSLPALAPVFGHHDHSDDATSVGYR